MKTLLASSVPNLEFDFLASQLDCFDLKINANCGNKSGVEGIVTESKTKKSVQFKIIDQKSCKTLKHCCNYGCTLAYKGVFC